VIEASSDVDRNTIVVDDQEVDISIMTPEELKKHKDKMRKKAKKARDKLKKKEEKDKEANTVTDEAKDVKTEVDVEAVSLSQAA